MRKNFLEYVQTKESKYEDNEFNEKVPLEVRVQFISFADLICFCNMK